MPNPPPEDPFKALWQNQKTEAPAMSVDAIRARAARYQFRLGVRNLLMFGLILAEIGFFGWAASKAKAPLVQAGDLVILAGLSWMIWRVIRRWPERLPSAASSADTLLDFHRRQLLRQRVTLKDITVTTWPVLFGIGMVVTGQALRHPHLANQHMIRIAVLATLWVAGAWYMQRRHAHKLKIQLDDVEDARKD